MSLSIAGSRHSQPRTAERDLAQHEEDPLPLEPDELLCALQAENTRLQALVCYLVHVNQELRQQNRASQLPANAEDLKAAGM